MIRTNHMKKFREGRKEERERGREGFKLSVFKIPILI